MAFFARLGPVGCELACGGMFLSMSSIIAALALSIEELRLIRSTKFLQVPAVALLSLSFFVCSGAEVLLTSALFWWLGAIVAGIATLELGSITRIYVWQRVTT